MAGAVVHAGRRAGTKFPPCKAEAGSSITERLKEGTFTAAVIDMSIGLAAPGFDLRDLPRETRCRIGRRLPRSGVVERAHDEDRRLRAACCEHFLRELADAVRIGRTDRIVFPEQAG